MNPDLSLPFAFVQNSFLLILILVLFVGLAGGSGESVLKQLIDIAVRIGATVLSAAVSLIIAVLRVIPSILLSSMRAVQGCWNAPESNRTSRY